MDDEYVYPDIPQKKLNPKVNNEFNMYITTGPPDRHPRPSQAAVMKRTVERSQDGAYELAGGGNVIYNLSQRRVSIESIEEQRIHKNCFEAAQKKIGVTILIVIVIGISVGVGIKVGVLVMSEAKKNETGIYY